MPANTVSTIRPAGEVVSAHGSPIDRSPAPTSFSRSAISSRSRVERASRSSLLTTTTSSGLIWSSRRASSGRSRSTPFPHRSGGSRLRSGPRAATANPGHQSRRVHTRSECRKYVLKHASLATDFCDTGTSENTFVRRVSQNLRLQRQCRGSPVWYGG